MTSPIAAGGLVLDIGGALALASAFMFKRPRAWRQEATTYVGMNAPLFLSAAKQTADAQMGAVLLTAGFAAQFSASVGADPAWACLWWTLPAAIAIDVIAAVILLRFLRPFQVRRALAYDLEQKWPQYQDDYPDRDEAAREWWIVLEAWGHLVYEEKPRPGEELPDFGERLLGKRRWRRIEKPPPPT